MDEDKKQLSEQDICLRYITPAIEAAGWEKTQIRREFTLTAGRVIVRGRLSVRGERSFADYVLFHKHGQPPAAVEAEDNKRSAGSGKTPRYYQIKAIKRTVAAATDGQDRILLVIHG